MSFQRGSGILMHISSLPNKVGIGTIGKEAYDFVDFLKASNQKYWQILPLNPTNYGDSPYQSVSTFAGNPYFIDVYDLVNQGYINEDDINKVVWCKTDNKVDYNIIYIQRHKLFKKVFNKFKDNIPQDFDTFCNENKLWLDDFSFFMALKDYFSGMEFSKWNSEIRNRNASAMAMYKTICSEEILYWKMLQYFFFKQWFKLKKYANDNGILIIGDMPIYVARDSCDVWSNPKYFSVDKYCVPYEVAGCPPDDFAKQGQLWGNPVYDWNVIKDNNFKWWIDRINFSFKIYDVIRLDHFRGFSSYYTIDAKDKTAVNGKWKNSIGIELFDRIKKELGDLPFIAEDLGFLTDDVKKLLKDTNFAGMKVLQFGFDDEKDNDYYPNDYPKNSVAYTGTHDNDTILGWCKSGNKSQINNAIKKLNAKNKDDLVWKMMDYVLNSTSDICILTMQDLLHLDSDSRMNTPSTLGSNWQFRIVKNQLNNDLSNQLKQHTISAKR